ncbi:MAG: DUF4105 domain-containing protein [Candidatus Binatia bacterium]|nr:DUF4105 domain-containing protein [Candidatus Binatia bacterium]
MKFLFGILLSPVVLGCAAWAVAALWIDGPESHALAGALGVAFSTAALAVFLIVRPMWRALGVFGVLFLLVVGWWFTIAPSNDRVWEPSVAQMPRASLDGDLLTFENVRNFDYRSETDFDEVWETRTYDLSAISGVGLLLSYWSSPLIAHTMMTWTFEDGPPLAISIETRKEEGEEYSAVLGFFRQFELYYVVADERDVVRVRTNYRGEDVYLYPLDTTPETARRLLLDYVARINELADQAVWYNAATHNCTTTIRHHTAAIGASGPWDYRFLVNGYLDELAYESGVIDTSLPFPEVRRRANIVDRANAADTSPTFSTQIRSPGGDAR